jgi:hypothetical protein
MEYCESGGDLTMTRVQLWNPEEGKRPPLEAGTRGLVKRQQTGNTESGL